MSTGSLGQGISAAVGMALGGKLKNKDYRVYTLVGDGEIDEGQVWEALMFASHRKLDNLCVIVDNNGLQLDGTIDEIIEPNPLDEKFESFGCHVIKADGHDFDSLEKAFNEAKTVKGQPTVIIAKTVKGKGVSFMENNVLWHGAAPNDEQYKQAMEELEKAGRAFDQLRNSVGYPHLNVKVGATHGGISVGQDGATHQCNEDFALMRTIPGMVVICPSDDVEARAAVKAAKETGKIVTVEEHSVIGGLGSVVADVVSEENLAPVHKIGVQDVFGESALAEELLEKHGLDAKGIYNNIKDYLNK